jgi:hypothetical protein
MPHRRRWVATAAGTGLVVLAFSLGPAPASAAFARRKVITIDRMQVPGTANHVDFPVLVSITANADLRTTAYGGSVASAQGNDILFRGEDATTCSPAASPCRLDHEIESYDGATGTLVAWVRVPTLRYSGYAGPLPLDTSIYMYYGDATVTCSQQNKAGVWDASYREVFHLNEAGDHVDSTKNAFTAVGKGAVTNGATGQIGPAVDFGGGVLGTTPARLVVSDGKLPTTTSFTFEAWVSFRSYVPGGYVGFVTKGRECLNFDGSPVPQPTFCSAEPCGDWVSLYKAGSDRFSLGWAWGDGVLGCKVGNMDDPGPVVTIGPWYHVAGSFDLATKTRRLLVNGDEVVMDTGSACLEADIPHYGLMGIDNLENDYLDGVLDEVRVSFAARSNDWIKTGYNNQSSPATFYAVVDEGGPFAVSATACPSRNPCAGGPGTCYLRSIGDTAAYSAGSGTCTATNGSSVVTCPGAGWQSANRGRGDRITIDGSDYMVLAVDGETQLRLSTPFTGTTGIGNKSYTMSRQFATLQAWEDCISTGGAACTYFPVANGNLVTGSRSEVGIVYKEASPYTASGASIVEFSGSTTDANHTITLTADGVNRHYGIRGAGVVLDNGTTNTTRPVLIGDQFVTVEWLEIARGGDSGAHCIDFVPSNSVNHAVIRNNIVRNCSGQSIRLAGSASAHVADINNNFIFRGAREGVRIQSSLGTGTGSQVRIFNNTFFRNNANTVQPYTEISTAERPNPYVVLRNNVLVDDTQAPDVTWNGLALCTNAANCDWWNAASGNNIVGDAAPPTGKWKSDIGPNPRGGGLAWATEASLAFVNTASGSENFHLVTGSTAYNRGADLTGAVQGDIDATIRTAPWDVGADELPPAAAPPLIAYSDSSPPEPALRPLRYTTLQGSAWSAPGQVAVPGPFPTGSDWPLLNKVARTSADGLRRGVVFVEGDLGNRNPMHGTFWDGTSWTDGAGSAGSYYIGVTGDANALTSRHFDAAFEQQSGDFLVVTGTNADESVDIYLHSGGAWSGNLRFTPPGNGTMLNQAEVDSMVFRWVRLAPRPGTNRIAFIGLAHDTGTGTYGVVHAAIWNGDTDTFGSKTILSYPLTNTQNSNSGDAIDIDYVLGGTNAGEAVAVWGNQTQIVRRICSAAGTWGSNAVVQDLAGAGGGTVRWIRQKAASNSDNMILAVEDVNEKLYTILYDGDTRTFASFMAQTPATTLFGDADKNRAFDVAWDFGLGANNVMLVYSDATGIWYRTSANGGALWAGPTQITNLYQARWIQLERDPSNVVHLVVMDQNNDLRAWKWTASTWTVTSTPTLPSTDLETNSGAQNVEPFALATWPPLGSATTAVKLMSFAAVPGDSSVTLEWQTGSELDNLGFHVYRGPTADGPWTRLTSSLIPGLGSSPLGQAYSWLDRGLVNGTRYYYRLEDVDTASKSTFHGPVSAVPVAASSPPGEGGGDDGGGDGTEGGGGETVPGSCPQWILAAAPDAVSPACTAHGSPEAVSLQVLARTTSGATLELQTGGFWTLEDASRTVRVFVPGLEFPPDPKAPALPLRRALVDAVVGKQVHLVSAEALELRSFPDLRPSTVGQAEMAVGRDGTIRPSRRSITARFLSRGLVPQEVARLSGTAFQGERKSAVVEITPVRFSASRNELVLAGRVRVRLSFAGAAAGEFPAGGGGRALPRKGFLRDVLAQLHTTRRGLHAVSYEDLFPTSRRGVSTTLLRLQRQGEAVPFSVKPWGPVFGPGSVLYFDAERTVSSTEYSGEVAYELVRGVGERMGVVSAAPTGAPLTLPSTGYASFETNRIYQPGLLEAPDIWLWDGMASGVVRVKPFTLEGVVTESAQLARLGVYLQGGSDAPETEEDHHVRVNVNGVDVGEAFFGGKWPYRLEAEVPASLLREGGNELAVVNVGDTGVYSLVFLDRFELSYPRAAAARGGVFAGVWAQSGTVEVSGLSGTPVILRDTPGPEGSAVKWLTGFQMGHGSVRFQAEAGYRYTVISPEGLLSPRIGRVPPSTLKAGTNQADYLVIAPREFLEAAQPLVERRRSQGLVSRAVSFEEIASEFGHGQPSAEAIREFLRYAYHSWQGPSPRYVVLLGDATYDPQRFLSTSWASPLPALWEKTSYLWTASDPALAAVNGEDLLPDLAIGRLPATSREQAEAFVSKLLAWEDSGQSLGGDAVLVADTPDLAGDFEANVEDIHSSFLSDRSTRTLKVRELGAGTRPAILGSFDDGASLMSYVGHGGTAVWSSSNVLNSWDAASLQAQSRQPLLLTLNCLNGYFVAPNFDSLSESLVKVGGRGAVAALSPSGLSLDGPAHQYHRALMGELVSGAHERLGDAVLAAQRDYAETGLMPELLEVYQLLGDPAMRIR